MTFVKPAAALLPDLTNCPEIDPKDQAERWRSVYLVRNREGDLVVKPLRIGTGRAALTGRLLSGNRDCPVLPKLVKTWKGDNYWWRGGNRYLITRQISGREADYFRIADLGAVIRAMAEFHLYTGKIVAAQQPGWGLLAFEPEQAWRQAYLEMERCHRLAVRAGDIWSREYLKLWHHFSAQATQAIREIGSAHGCLPKVLCYHDWAHHNVIIGATQAYLIDFDALVIDWPTHDRANLVGRYLRLHGWTNRALLQLLGNFDRFYPCHQDELPLLRTYLTFPYDYWMLGRQYYLERQPWSKRYFHDQWERKIEPYQAREKVLEWLGKI